MARVPISFYLNILAGIIVIFNHHAASETGDVALNKVTGATGRFYNLFRDTALAFQHGCTSRLETVLCGSAMESVFPHDAVAHLRSRYCHLSTQDSENVGGASNGQRSPGGYDGSDFAFVYYQPSIRPLVPRPSVGGSLGRSPFSLDWSSQSHLSQAVWVRTSEAVATIGALLLRTSASWWWFRAPLKVTSVLLAIYSALLAFGYLFGASMVIRCVSQVYMVAVADFLQCIQWEAQHQVLDMGVMTMERAYSFFTYVG